MAIWQVTIELIPTSWAEKYLYDTESLYDSEGMYDASHTWIDNQPTADFEKTFSTFLPVKKSWNEDLRIWGKEKEDDIQVWCEEGLVESIGFRIDLRKDFSKIIKDLMFFASKMNCVLFFPNN